MRLYRPTPNLFDGRVQAGLFDSLPLGDVLPACAAPAAQTALLDPPQGDGDNPTVAEYMAHGVSAEDAARALADRIWTAETGTAAPASVLDKVISRSTSGGRISFRRVVQALVPLLAKGQ